MQEKNTMISAGWNLDNSYANLPDRFFTKIDPVTVRRPELIILNHSLAASLGLEIDYLESEEGIKLLAGNRIPEGSIPIAQAYAGHQFGHFTMLGDGRAVLLGEQLTPLDRRYDIQLKGSGRTPYSRGGDGRAALGPMLREYIISEAMYALGIPTTRSLAVVTTGEPVFRETVQPGAVLTRVADSHIRVGTFQYISTYGTKDELRALADYTFERHFSGSDNINLEVTENRYISLLKGVIERQAYLIAKWQLVGFIHGVMNTDNMAISGETIDYGPCAFMDTYDPKTVFSSIDIHGRYSYGNQPKIAEWNLRKFAETLLPLINENKEQAIIQAQEAIADFQKIFFHNWIMGMRSKLGIFNKEKNDELLIDDFLKLMKKYGADYTNTFRALTLDKLEGSTLFDSNEFVSWKQNWKDRLGMHQESVDDIRQRMRESNPAVIPRNHRVEEALESAVKNDNMEVLEQLLDILANPFAYSREQDEYALLPETSNCAYRTFCGT